MYVCGIHVAIRAVSAVGSTDHVGDLASEGVEGVDGEGFGVFHTLFSCSLPAGVPSYTEELGVCPSQMTHPPPFFAWDIAKTIDVPSSH